MKARIGVLLSGRGSNFEALATAIDRGEVPAEIVLVLSDRPAAPGLERARQRGIEARAILPESDRAEHDSRLVRALSAARVDWVCLAGYMRLLGSGFVRAYPERILNIHPSLLPAFPGLHAQHQALEYGVRVAGCTVHLVDEGLDSGPIVLQESVPVEPDDDEASLAARILEREHVAYPAALQLLLTRPWTIEGRRVVVG